MDRGERTRREAVFEVGCSPFEGPMNDVLSITGSRRFEGGELVQLVQLAVRLDLLDVLGGLDVLDVVGRAARASRAGARWTWRESDPHLSA